MRVEKERAEREIYKRRSASRVVVRVWKEGVENECE